MIDVVDVTQHYGVRPVLKGIRNVGCVKHTNGPGITVRSTHPTEILLRVSASPW